MNTKSLNLTMGVLKTRLNLKKSRFHTSNPTYLADNFFEYIIKFEEGRGYYIHKYNGGGRDSSLQGHFRTHSLAEKQLISFLMKTDKTGMARWPGKQRIRHTNYTRTFLKDG